MGKEKGYAPGLGMAVAMAPAAEATVQQRQLRGWRNLRRLESAEGENEVRVPPGRGRPCPGTTLAAPARRQSKMVITNFSVLY
jgi:hypothetical protein